MRSLWVATNASGRYRSARDGCGVSQGSPSVVCPGRVASSSVLMVPKNRSILPRPWGRATVRWISRIWRSTAAWASWSLVVAAVVDVEHVGQAAHQPGRVGLVPDRLAGRCSSPTVRPEDCSRRPPGQSSRIVVSHGRAGLPWCPPGCRAWCDRIAHRVGAALLAGVAPARACRAVGRCALQGEGDHAGIRVPHDVPHHRVGGDRPSPGGADASDFAMDRGDGRPRLAQCQALDQVDEVGRKAAGPGVRP